MGTMRKLKRQQAHSAAQRLSSNGKHGKSKKLFKMIWKGQQAATKEKKEDKELKAALSDAKKRAKTNRA